MNIKWDDRGKIGYEAKFDDYHGKIPWERICDATRKYWNNIYDAVKNSCILECGNGEKIILGDKENG